MINDTVVSIEVFDFVRKSFAFSSLPTIGRKKFCVCVSESTTHLFANALGTRNIGIQKIADCHHE